MRKVFFSLIKLQNDDKPEKISVFKSRDIELSKEEHCAPISYLLDANIDADDEILIITGISQADVPQKNYKELKQDMDNILSAHGAKAEFVELASPDPKVMDREDMDSLTFSRFFKDFSEYLQDGDRIYADMTFGIKCNTLCSFIAMSYAVKAGENIDVEQMVYGERYDGNVKDNPGQRPTTDIIDITSLFYISNMVSNSKPGQKKSMDSFLDFMIR